MSHELKDRSKIYLDLKFWIYLREADLNAEADPKKRELLRLLRDGVAQKKLICPVSATVIEEVLKQADTESRRKSTCRIVDELSTGVCLLDGERRNATEIACFFHDLSFAEEGYKPSELVWTKVVFAFGYFDLPALQNDHSNFEIMLERCFDYLWRQNFSEVLERLKDAPPNELRLKQFSKGLDLENKTHASDLKSFEKAYRDEISGAIDISGDAIVEVLEGIANRKRNSSHPSSGEEIRRLKNIGQRAMSEEFKKNSTKFDLRTMHSTAALHAAFRWNKGATFKPNDFWDLDHAIQAVSYCDAFLTERPLAHLLSQKNVQLEEINGCRIISELDVAISFLNEIVNHPSNRASHGYCVRFSTPSSVIKT